MCTVTFLPLGDTNFILTSNRDESPGRKIALPPQKYLINDLDIVFPRDAQANGTWIASSENNFTLCLLNGAFEYHKHNPPYRLSRGLVVLDFFDFVDADDFVKKYDLSGIEPFTLLVVDHKNQHRLTEIRWDENEKVFISDKKVSQPHIWSSATLYPLPIRQQREIWFKEWLSDRDFYQPEDILNFHHFGGTGDKKNDILMDRSMVHTVSITCITKNSTKAEMLYEDLVSNELKKYIF